MKSNKIRIALRQAVYLFLAIIALSLLITGFLFFAQLAQYEKQVSRLLQHLSVELQQEISAGDHASITAATDDQNPAFLRIRQQIRTFAKKHAWPPQQIYTYQYGGEIRRLLSDVHPREEASFASQWRFMWRSLFPPAKSSAPDAPSAKNAKDAKDARTPLRFAVMTHEVPFIDRAVNMSPELLEKLAILNASAGRTGIPAWAGAGAGAGRGRVGDNNVVTVGYQDQYGRWMSALSFLRDEKARNETGILVIDYRLNLGEEIFYQELEKVLLILLACAIVLSIIFYRKYRRYLVWSTGLAQLGRASQPEREDYKNIKKILRESANVQDHRGFISQSILKLLDRTEFLQKWNLYLAPIVRDGLAKKGSEQAEVGGEEKEMAILAMHIGMSGNIAESYDKTGKMKRIANRVYGDFLKATEKGKGRMERATGSLLLGYFQGPNAAFNAVRAAMEMIFSLDSYWDSSVGGTDRPPDATAVATATEAGNNVSASASTLTLAPTSTSAPQARQGIRMGVSMGPVMVTEVHNKNYRDIIHWGDDIEIAIKLAWQAEPFELLFPDRVFNDVFDYSELPKGFKIMRKGQVKTVFSKKSMKIYSIKRSLEEAQQATN